MTTARRLTAGNSPFLAAARKVFNAPIYTRIMAAMNGPGGEAEARAIAARYIRLSVEDAAASLAGTRSAKG